MANKHTRFDWDEARPAFVFDAQVVLAIIAVAAVVVAIVLGA